MPWFYNSNSGELGRHDGVDALAYEAALHTGSGWHELRISDSATFTQAATEALKEVPGGTKPTGGQVQGLKNLPASAANPLTNGLLPDNFLMRTGEVLIGLILLAIGLSVMLKGTPVGDAVGAVAKNVPKVVPV